MSEVDVRALTEFSTPSICNGLKRLGVDSAELQSFDRQVVHCVIPPAKPVVGYAVTRVVATRRSGPTTDAVRNTELTWRSEAAMAALPEPRVLVVENIGDWRGPVCIWGEVMAHVNTALGICAGITNGPVRDVPEMAAAGFIAFAGGVAVGGGHVDLVEVNAPVSVAGMTVAMGDLLHGDMHGVVKVPIELVPALPDAIRQHAQHERRIIELCRSSDFSREALGELMGEKGR
jgi:regulator of RNase E activity RraA